MIIGGILFFSLVIYFCWVSGCSLIIKGIVSTLAAWFLGLVLDANIPFGRLPGFTCFRILFPILTMGTFLLISNSKKNGS